MKYFINYCTLRAAASAQLTYKESAMTRTVHTTHTDRAACLLLTRFDSNIPHCPYLQS